jgi:L-glyceraldehyde 3-phosphate reductase
VATSTGPTAAGDRYDGVEYRQVGSSGLYLPPISLGLWWNFGDNIPFDNQRALLRHAFDSGITHFDLANNYGPPYGTAETNFGRMMREDFRPYRDELIISSKAGWDMWPGPYGTLGSRKYILASAEQSLQRMGIDYVDIFYSHRFDPVTPLEETIGALDTLVRQARRSTSASRPTPPSAPSRRRPSPGHSARRSSSTSPPTRSSTGGWRTASPRCCVRRAWAPSPSPARPGPAHGQVPRRRHGRPGPAALFAAGPSAERHGPVGAAQPRRHREGARPEPRPDGAAVGAARRRRDVGPDRRVAARAARREPRRAAGPAFDTEELEQIDAVSGAIDVDLWAESATA